MNTAITGAIVTVLSLSLPVVAATTIRYQVKGQSASAYFSQMDECIQKNIQVFVFANMTKVGLGSPTQQMEVNVGYDNYNYCTGTYSGGFGSSPNAKFTIDNRLNSATLTGTFTIVDSVANTTETVEVNLAWAGTGIVTKNKSSFVYRTPTSATRLRGLSENRIAQVSGSVILDSIDLTDNTISDGSLSSYANGTLERIKK